MVSSRLRQLRQAKGYTLDQLSEISGVNRGTIHRIELDQVSPRMDTLDLLCKALGMDFQGFFTAGARVVPGLPVDQGKADPRIPSPVPDRVGGPGGFREGILNWLEHLEALIQASADGLAVADQAGFIFYQSQVSMRLRGDVVRGQRPQPWFLCAHHEDQAVLEAGFQRVVEQPGEVFRLEYRAPTPEGGWRWLRSTLLNQLDHPTIQGVVITTHDISGWKRGEAQRSRLQNLEAQVQVMGAMTAEFSNLWTSVQGQLDTSRTNGETLGGLAGLQGTLDRASRLLHQMRDVCGHPRLDLGPVDLNELVRKQTAAHRASFGSQLVVELDLPASLPLVTGDSELLGRLVGYLLNHLLEARDGVPGKLCLTTTQATLTQAQRDLRFLEAGVDGGDDFVVLEFQDAGALQPVATEVAGLDLVSPTGFPAKSLVLPAALRTIRDHRGGLELEPLSETGNLIRVFLPVAEAAIPQARGEAKPGRDILLVEDEETILVATADMLQELGYEVLLARNGREALDLHAQAQGSVGLVLLDLNMPVLNGEETYRALRLVDPQVKVLLCTGAAGSPAHGNWNQGMAGTLRKPYRFEDLRDAVEALLPR